MKTPMIISVGIAIQCCVTFARAGNEVVTWGCDGLGKPFSAVYSLPDSVPLQAVKKLCPAGYAGGLLLDSYGNITTIGKVSPLSEPPVDLTNVVDLASSRDHAVALRRDGTVIVWGNGNNNRFGKLTVPQGLTNITAVEVACDSCFAIRSNGTVAAWGMDRMPVGASNLIAVSASTSWFSRLRVALGRDGTVIEWVRQPPKATPHVGLSNVVAISSGAVHNLGLKKDGTVEAWGSNAYGETKVPAGLSNVVAIAAGGDHDGVGTGAGFSLAMRNDGTVVGWGILGPQNAPVVPDGLSNVVAIAAGANYCLAITINAAVAERFMQKGK